MIRYDAIKGQQVVDNLNLYTALIIPMYSNKKEGGNDLAVEWT